MILMITFSRNGTALVAQVEDLRAKEAKYLSSSLTWHILSESRLGKKVAKASVIKKLPITKK